MGAISRSFGLQASAAPAAAGRGRSYFLTRLLTDVVFSEAALAGIDIKGERRRRISSGPRSVRPPAVVVLAIVLWAMSYSYNANLVESLDQETAEARVRLEDFNEAPPDLDEMSRVLSQVRALPTGFDDRDVDPPMRAGFGLYQGEKLGRVTQDAYVRTAAQDAVAADDLPHRGPIAPESRRPGVSLRDPEDLPDARAAGAFDAEQVNSWYQFDLERFPPRMFDDARYQALFDHASALFNNLEVPIPYALDEELVADVRGVLRAVPLAQRVLERLEIEADYAREITPFRIDEAAGAQAAVVFERASGKALDDPLNGLYTWAGYHGLLKPELRNIALRLLKETWVIGDEQRSATDSARELAALISEVARCTSIPLPRNGRRC